MVPEGILSHWGRKTPCLTKATTLVGREKAGKRNCALERSGEGFQRDELEKSYDEWVFNGQRPRDGKVVWQLLETMEVLGSNKGGWGVQHGRLQATCILGPPAPAEDQNTA